MIEGKEGGQDPTLQAAGSNTPVVRGTIDILTPKQKEALKSGTFIPENPVATPPPKEKMKEGRIARLWQRVLGGLTGKKQ